MHLGHYLVLLHRSQLQLGAAFRTVAHSHADEHDVRSMCERLAAQCDAPRRTPEAIRRSLRRGRATTNPTASTAISSRGPATARSALLRDLHDLYLMACECDIVWTRRRTGGAGRPRSRAAGDRAGCESETTMQTKWARGRMKEAAPQALVVA